MNYQLVVAGNQPNDNADPHNTDDDVDDVAFDVKENENNVHVSPSESGKTDNKKHDEKAKRDNKGKSHVDSPTRVRDLRAEYEEFSSNNTNMVNAVSAPVTAAGPNPTDSTNNPSKYPNDPDMPKLEEIVYSDDEEDVGAEVDLSNLETNIPVSRILTTRVYKDHPVNQIIVDLNSAPLTRNIIYSDDEEDIGAEADFSNLETSIPGEGIDYEEVFAPFARIEAIQLFPAYVSFMGFMVYQMDVKSAFIYGTIEEEVYVCQPPEFEDPDYPDKVYKVVKALYGLHQAPRAWNETLDNYLLGIVFKGEILIRPCLSRGKKQKDNGIFISQDKYMTKILRKFGLTDGKSASTPFDTEKPLLKDPDGEDVDVHTYSDYAGASLDRRSTTGGCQFLGCRLISWQCKKQTVVATSSIEVEYVAAASCCAQVLWIQNQLLDYG
nr:hypothetical protein [Tanacetum cinerariifolium]